jgi:hypothetical protein
LLSQRREELERIARALLERETLGAEQLQQLLKAASANTAQAGEREAADHPAVSALEV